MGVDTIFSNEVRYIINDHGFKIVLGASANGDQKNVKWHTAVFIPLGLVGAFQGGLEQVLKNYQASRQNEKPN